MAEDEETLFWLLMSSLGLALKLQQQSPAIAIKMKRRYRKKRFWIHPILKRRQQQGDYNNLVQELRMFDEVLFFNYTRMSVQSFDKLLNLVGKELQKGSIRESISPGCRLALTLRFLATGDSYKSIGYAFRVGVPTVCNIVREVCAVMWHILSPEYVSPPTKRDYIRIGKQFTTRWGLPNCLGAIDGKHIVLQAPYGSGSRYFNYKKTFSIVLMGVCDGDYNFILVDIGAYGSESDGGILNRSVFGQKLLSNTLDLPNSTPLPKTTESKPYFFIGDEAFPLRPNLLRPYSKPRNRNLTEQERIFNYRLSRARRIIENTFGVMVARFRIFHRVIIGKPQTVIDITKACICLHNYIRREKYGRYCDDEYVDREDKEGNVIPGRWRVDVNVGANSVLVDEIPCRLGARNESREAYVYRDYLKDYVNGVGSYLAPWQFDYVRKTN